METAEQARATAALPTCSAGVHPHWHRPAELRHSIMTLPCACLALQGCHA